jgi:hypothetical protein
MPEDGPETNYRKKALAFGSTLLAGSIFTGPAAPIVALVGGAFILGTGLRHLLNRNARGAYNEERGASRRREDSDFDSFYPESAETAIARRRTSEAARLLREYSKDRTYEEALSSASVISRDYLSSLPEEMLAKSKGVRVSFEKKRSLVGFLTGDDNEFKLNIHLK